MPLHKFNYVKTAQPKVKQNASEEIIYILFLDIGEAAPLVKISFFAVFLKAVLVETAPQVSKHSQEYVLRAIEEYCVTIVSSDTLSLLSIKSVRNALLTLITLLD